MYAWLDSGTQLRQYDWYTAKVDRIEKDKTWAGFGKNKSFTLSPCSIDGSPYKGSALPEQIVVSLREDDFKVEEGLSDAMRRNTDLFPSKGNILLPTIIPIGAPLPHH